MRNALLTGATILCLLLGACGTDDTREAVTSSEGGSQQGAVGQATRQYNPDCSISSEGETFCPSETPGPTGPSVSDGFQGTGEILCGPPTLVPAPKRSYIGPKLVPVPATSAVEKGVTCYEPEATPEPRPPCKPGEPATRHTTKGVTGCVTNPEGKPFYGASLVLEALDAAAPIPDIGVLTGTDGRYIYDVLPPGTYRLTISFEGYVSPTKEVTVGEKPVTLDFVLRPESK